MPHEHVWNLFAKKLSGEATSKELLELEQILRHNAGLHYSMQTVVDFWQSSEPQHPENFHDAFDKHIERAQSLGLTYPVPGNMALHEFSNSIDLHTSKKRRTIFKVAGAAVVAALCIYLLGKGADKTIVQPAKTTISAVNEVATKNGSKTNLLLPDGTSVKLNAGSKVSYDKDYGNVQREVYLTGEAFFDVTHNVKKPFIIHTSSFNIIVTGTRFNVKCYPGDKTTEATLIKGSIEVSFKDRPAQHIILKANQKIIVSNTLTSLATTSLVKERDNPRPAIAIRNLSYEPNTGDIIETAWMDDKLIFQDETFGDLAVRMERWYGVAIRFDDAKQKAMRFTGTFKRETVQQALEALKMSNDFQYRIAGSEITVFD